MIKVKKLRKKIKPYRFIIVAALLSFAIVGVLLTFKLGGLTTGVSAQENSYIQSIASGKSIIDNPMYLAHKIPTHLLHKSGQNSIAIYRLVSVAWASVAVFALWALLKQWYSPKIAIMGTGLFVCSAWSLHTSRLATVEVLYLSFLPIFWGILWSFRLQNRTKALLVMIACTTYSLYIPGMILLPLGIVVWRRKHFLGDLGTCSARLKVLFGLIFICAVIPLLYATVKSPSLALTTLGLPVNLPELSAVYSNFQEVIKSLTWGSHDANPANWISGTPLLDVFSLTMLALGVYSLRFSYQTGRNKVLISYALVSFLMIIASPISLVALLPFIYIHVASGIAFMLQQWFAVFPKNPVARTFGTVLITCAVVGVSFFHIYSYFVAWPQVPETRSAFTSIDLVQ